MIRHMRHGSSPGLMAPQPILGSNRRESLATPSAGDRITGRLLRHRSWDRARSRADLRALHLQDREFRRGEYPSFGSFALADAALLLAFRPASLRTRNQVSPIAPVRAGRFGDLG